MSVPPELMAMLQGGGGGGAPAGPPPDMGGGGGGGIPPELMAMLGGGGDPAAGGGAPPEAAEGEVPSGAMHSGSAAPGDPNEDVMAAIDSLTQAAHKQVDDELINVYTTCIANLQKTLSKQQAGADGMASGKFDQAAMRQMGAADAAY